MPRDASILRWIAAFKLAKALGLITLAALFLTLIHPTPSPAPTSQPIPVNAPAPIAGIRSPARLTHELLHRLLDRARHLSPHHRRLLLTATCLYAALYLFEGIGLLYQKRWAEWIVIATTSLFIPLELYEALHKTTLLHAAVLAINTIVLLYLLHHLRSRPAPLQNA